MTPDQWARVSDVLDATLERRPEERWEFVAVACSGDAAIQTEVQRLLALHDRASGFMNTPAWLRGALPIRLRDSDGETEASVPPSLTALKPGEIFANRYEIQAELGRGGFGVVYSALDTGLHRSVALKVICLASGEPSEIRDLARRRFLEEARIAANLSHHNIATVYDASESTGSIFMTQELAPGWDLRKLLKEAGALSPRRSIAIARQICAGLGHAHVRGVVHRDIKPGNIIVDAEDGVKVTDFGIAQPPQEDSPLSGAIGGTPGYMAPEQLRAGRVDGRADIFAVGCVLYEMLAGCRPFEGATTEMILDGLHPEPSRMRGDLPRALDRIVARAMKKSPDERYSDIGQLQQDLARYEAPRRVRALVAALALMVTLVTTLYFRYRHRELVLRQKDSLLVADFSNNTGDPVFDESLKQGLAMALSQSPFLNVVPDTYVAVTLQQMQRPTGTAVTGEVAREVCQRADGRAYIAGSISKMGSQYSLGLRVVGCLRGETLAQEQATAFSKEEVLNTLGREAAKLREKVGESLATVREFDRPLAQGTTSSLEALKAYSIGLKVGNDRGYAEALPQLQRAVQIDPSFASGYMALGVAYSNVGQMVPARECIGKAFALRERTSEKEKVASSALYYDLVTGQLQEAQEAYQEWIEDSPKEYAPYTSLSAVSTEQGDYASCVVLTRRALSVRPDYLLASENEAWCLISQGRLYEARKALEEMPHAFDNDVWHLGLYALGFVAADSRGMASEAAWFNGKPGVEYEMLAAEADTEASGGRLTRARELTRRAADAAVHAGSPDSAGLYREVAALREAAFGDTAEAQEEATRGLKFGPQSRDLVAQAALSAAWAGDKDGARELENELNRFPLDTLVNSYWRPTIEARLALAENDPAGALARLQSVSSVLELGAVVNSTMGTCPYPVYTRGEAYLAADKGNEAAGEFQKILDHPGVVVNCPVGALAHLGLGRAHALEAGIPLGTLHERRGEAGDDRLKQDGAPFQGKLPAPLQPEALAKARAAYQEFFAAWKDADVAVPILKQAKAEYAKLK